ncbi:hypothetical protein H5410_051580 [Solanum commersonii]|uniref:Uncharacterized protein n=1 Tax=Solanum commersonii TaxID=4109 RepID=A0A9J5WYJ7_SOLCO|nr:hypothetical protein H5410_051580 [Solanum commersonii]
MLAKNQERRSLDVILKTPLIKKKWSECSNPKKQPPPDIIEETCDNDHIKEKMEKVSNSMGKDLSRSKTSEGTDGKRRGKKRERVGQDIDRTFLSEQDTLEEIEVAATKVVSHVSSIISGEGCVLGI